MISHFLFCWPKRWETINRGVLVNTKDVPIGEYWNLRCTKCGWIKQRRCY